MKFYAIEIPEDGAVSLQDYWDERLKTVEHPIAVVFDALKNAGDGVRIDYEAAAEVLDSALQRLRDLDEYFRERGLFDSMTEEDLTGQLGEGGE